VTGATLRVKGAALRVIATEPIGPYTLLSVASGSIEPGVPGQFFMLQPPGHVLPRPMSLCLARANELCFLIDPIGPGTRTLCNLTAGETLHVLGPLGNGFDLTVPRPLIVGGGIGVAPFPYVAQVLGATLGSVLAILGFRTAHHAEAAALVPGAEVVVEPTYVTSLMPEGPVDVLACGPEPMLEAVRQLAPQAQLAWEAPMACGFGACYGCVVEIDGRLQRLCIAGPVLCPDPASRAGDASRPARQAAPRPAGAC
jgi:dihydroorotate dehydrogenase electron transfer subunit